MKRPRKRCRDKYSKLDDVVVRNMFFSRDVIVMAHFDPNKSFLARRFPYVMYLMYFFYIFAVAPSILNRFSFGPIGGPMNIISRFSSLYRMHLNGPHRKVRPNKNPLGTAPFAKVSVIF